MSVDFINAMLKDKNIQTMEDYISELPEEYRENFTLMHKSNSLHGSSYENPRAILFGKSGHWIFTFNGSPSQEAGEMIEIMHYDSTNKKYNFHEIDFSGPSPVFHENPTKCLACHGSTPRPIWDHYNKWPGAFGADDDRYTEEEYKYLEAFMKKAPEHPRYKHLLKLEEGYKLSRPGYRNGLSERTMTNRNRDLTLLLNQQRMKDVVQEMASHSDFPKVKGLIFYLLSKCYLPAGSTYQGDGMRVDDEFMKKIINKIKNAELPSNSYPFAPERSLDFIFSRLEVDTQNWYLSSRDLASYKSFQDGSERLHESFLNYFLAYTPEFREYFRLETIDYQIAPVTLAFVKNKPEACQEFGSMAIDGARALRSPLPDVNLPGMTMRGERVCTGIPRKCKTIYRTLPQICLKCHTQSEGGNKLYLPFHELPEMAQEQNTELIQKMYSYITSFRMPMRTSGDTAAFKQYSTNDYPKLKTYLEELLKKESSK